MLFYSLMTIILIDIAHIYFFLLLLGSSKISGRFVVVTSVLFTAFLSISVSLTGYPELNVVLLFGFLMALSMGQNVRVMHRILMALVSIVILTVMKNGLFVIFYELYMDSPFSYYMWTPNIISFCTLVFMMLVLILARNYIKASGRYLIESKLYIPSFVFIVICTVLLLIVNYPKIGLLAQLNAEYGEELYFVVLLIALVLLSIVTIRTYVTKERLIEQHEKLKQAQLMEYVEKLEFMHDELATFRHDYANVLLSLEESIRLGDIEQVKRVYEQTIAPTAVIFNHQQLELTKLARVEVIELKSVLSVKVLAAQRKSIKVALDIPHSITKFSMASDELIRVVSVLMDNAVEEAEKSGEKIIQIALFEMEGTQYIVIKNSVVRVDIGLKELYAKKRSTKGEGRGMGLYSVQRIVSKYPNVTLSTKIEPSFFTQELVVK